MDMDICHSRCHLPGPYSAFVLGRNRVLIVPSAVAEALICTHVVSKDITVRSCVSKMLPPGFEFKRLRALFK